MEVSIIFKKTNNLESSVPGPGKYEIKSLIDGSGTLYNSKFKSATAKSMTGRSKDSHFGMNTPGPGSYRAFSEFGVYESKFAKNDISPEKKRSPSKTSANFYNFSKISVVKSHDGGMMGSSNSGLLKSQHEKSPTQTKTQTQNNIHVEKPKESASAENKAKFVEVVEKKPKKIQMTKKITITDNVSY
jgi:hypothetical protein